MSDTKQYEGDVNVNVTMDTESKTYVKLKSDDFIEAAGLQRSGVSGRKSSVEKMLEESLNTNGDIHTSNHRAPSPTIILTNGDHEASDSDDDGAIRRGRTNVPQNINNEQFIENAGLSKTGRVARKSSMEKLLEDQFQTGEPDDSVNTSLDDSSDRYIIRQGSPTPSSDCLSTASDRRSSTSSTDDSKPKRRSSIYEQKQIEAPVTMKGNRITSRTENLFKQYERDMSVHEPKPIINVNQTGGGGSLYQRKASFDEATHEEKRKIDIVREEKERELLEMRQQYQQRLLQEEQEEAQERAKRIENEELKSVKSLGDVKNKYLTVAKGEGKPSDSEDESDGDKQHVDIHGSTIERGGGKEAVLKSSDGVGIIRERLGSIGKGGWKRRNKGLDANQVDSSKVNSARNLFKNIEANQSTTQQRSFSRPTIRKVKDPKELMEMRKKITYAGDQDGLPEDGVIKKSVIVEEDILATSPRKDALNVYKNLETKNDDSSPLRKPKTRLLSDSEARANMEVKKVESSSSEAGEALDINADVSGYDTGTPCSPTSTVSDGYSSLSDTKEIGNPDEIGDFKDSIHVEVSVHSDDDSVHVQEEKESISYYEQADGEYI